MKKIAILGAGGFGIAIAATCDMIGHEVSVWSLFEKEVQALETNRCNNKLLPGVMLSDRVNVTGDLSVVDTADVVIIAVPSFAVRSTAALAAPHIKADTVVVNVAKGLEVDENGNFYRLSEVISQEIDSQNIVVMTGPTHAEEIAKGVPSTITAASLNPAAAAAVQELFLNSHLRVYYNNDMVGAEVGGALKNCIALAAGIIDGMGLGDNTKAALMTRGLAEMARLGVAMGGRQDTFAGLSGVGDLIVTCTSVHSRNHRAGELIGKGMTAQEAIEAVGMTVEGYSAVKTAYFISHKLGVEMPIIEQMYLTLYENKPPKEALGDLMVRPQKHEMERPWNA